MTEAKIERNMATGETTCQNFMPYSNGSLVRLMPEFNGIVISYFEHVDYEGNLYLKPFVSTACKDNELSEKLTLAARKLLEYIPTIPL